MLDPIDKPRRGPFWKLPPRTALGVAQQTTEQQARVAARTWAERSWLGKARARERLTKCDEVIGSLQADRRPDIGSRHPEPRSTSSGLCPPSDPACGPAPDLARVGPAGWPSPIVPRSPDPLPGRLITTYEPDPKLMRKGISDMPERAGASLDTTGWEFGVLQTVVRACLPVPFSKAALQRYQGLERELCLIAGGFTRFSVTGGWQDPKTGKFMVENMDMYQVSLSSTEIDGIERVLYLFEVVGIDMGENNLYREVSPDHHVDRSVDCRGEG